MLRRSEKREAGRARSRRNALVFGKTGSNFFVKRQLGVELGSPETLSDVRQSLTESKCYY